MNTSSLTRRKHVCILPDTIQLSSRSKKSNSNLNQFLRLPNPRTRIPTLYLPFEADELNCKPDGILEVQKVTPEEENKRCWFVGEEILSDGTLTILTPFDPLYLLISLLSLLPSHYLSYDDLWETLSGLSIPLGEKEGAGSAGEAVGTNGTNGEDSEGDESMRDDIIRFGNLSCVKSRLEVICETQQFESKTLYRLSKPLALQILRSKISNLIDPITGIFGPLESTTLGKKHELETSAIVVKAVEAVEVVEKVDDGSNEVGKSFPTVSRGLAREGLGDGKGISEEIQLETRTKSAILILSNYLLPSITHLLSSSYSFKALSTHLSTISTSSVLSVNYLPGRSSSNQESVSSGTSTGNGFGSAAEREKKRKADAKGSRGVEILKKVNTRGMKSISEMFKMAPAKKKVIEVKAEAEVKASEK